jgi:hypothetical protein
MGVAIRSGRFAASFGTEAQHELDKVETYPAIGIIAPLVWQLKSQLVGAPCSPPRYLILFTLLLT